MPGNAVGEIFVELVFEIMIKGSGYILLRLFRPKSDPGEGACAIVGIIFWILVGTAAYFIYGTMST